MQQLVKPKIKTSFQNLQNKLQKHSERQYINNNNKFEHFCGNKARIKILKNYKEINKILKTKARLENDVHLYDSNDSEDEEDREKR